MPDMSGDGICSLLRKEPDPNPVKVLIAVEPRKLILNEPGNAALIPTSQNQLILLYSSVKLPPFLMSRPERLTGCR